LFNVSLFEANAFRINFHCLGLGNAIGIGDGLSTFVFFFFFLSSSSSVHRNTSIRSSFSSRDLEDDDDDDIEIDLSNVRERERERWNRLCLSRIENPIDILACTIVTMSKKRERDDVCNTVVWNELTRKKN